MKKALSSVATKILSLAWIDFIEVLIMYKKKDENCCGMLVVNFKKNFNFKCHLFSVSKLMITIKQQV